MILNYIGEIFDNLFLLINQLLIVLNYVLELNYIVVSHVCEFVVKFFATLQVIVEGGHIALVDFVDQYGELCTNLLQLFVSVVNKIVEYCLFSVVCVLHFVNSTVSIFLQCLQVPSLIAEKVGPAAEKIQKSTSEVVYYPVSFINNASDGFSMIIKTIFDAWVYVFSGIFDIFSSVSNFAFHSFAYCLRVFFSGVLFLIKQPYNAVVYVLRGVYNVPMEAFIGLVICVCIYYLIKFGVVRLLAVAWFKFCRNFLVSVCRLIITAGYKARYYLLPVGEMIIMYTVPQVMIVFQIFRWAKRPISTLISCVRVLYNFYLRITGKAVPVVNGEIPPVNIPANGNPYSESSERLLCIICQDAEKTVMAHPCRHVCMCRDCADEVLNSFRRQCPMCRAFIRDVIDVYL